MWHGWPFWEGMQKEMWDHCQNSKGMLQAIDITVTTSGAQVIPENS